jgi:hypothetical protein
VENCERRWRIARNIEIHGQNGAETSSGRKGLAENSSRDGTRAYRHHAFRVGHRFICLHQWSAHILADGSDDEQYVGGARGRREEDTKPVHVVERVVELPHFVEAGSAIPGVDDDDVEGTREITWERLVSDL